VVRIKVCGVTDPGQAVQIAGLGVHAVGLVFAKSPRRVDFETGRRIVAVLPPMIQAVGVFVNEAPDRIREAVAYCGLDLVQLHGEEPPEMCRSLGPRVMKAWRIRELADVDGLLPYQDWVRGFLLDAWSPGVHGGTGETFDWSIAVEAKRRLSRPIILAGGLNPANVREAVARVAPWGVDVSSGVEVCPGVKDLWAVKQLCMELAGGAGSDPMGPDDYENKGKGNDVLC